MLGRAPAITRLFSHPTTAHSTFRGVLLVHNDVELLRKRGIRATVQRGFSLGPRPFGTEKGLRLSEAPLHSFDRLSTAEWTHARSSRRWNALRSIQSLTHGPQRGVAIDAETSVPKIIFDSWESVAQPLTAQHPRDQECKLSSGNRIQSEYAVGGKPAVEIRQRIVGLQSGDDATIGKSRQPLNSTLPYPFVPPTKSLPLPAVLLRGVPEPAKS